jgi:very-short-patch-repair endonuclease
VANDFARKLRRNLTEAETKLWWKLRGRQIAGARFRRQAPIGKYIGDFVCFERGLVVELDGSQHVERSEKDESRTIWLNSQGFTVIRFWNNLIFEDLDSVLETIGIALTATPHPTLPHKGGGKESRIEP